MSVPPSQPPLETLGRRPFSFYPPILGIEHNEWVLRNATWSEILVENRKGGLTVWVPRRYIGETSRIDEPVMIVGLTKELEYKAGSVWPHTRRVIEMPAAAPPIPPASQESHPEPRGSGLGLRFEPGPERRIGLFLGIALLSVAVLSALIVLVLRVGPLRTRTVFTTRDQSYLELTRQDDYFAVVRKLGQPAEDRWRPQAGELQYRALWYPQRSYAVILMGTDRNDVRYIGTMDSNWRPVHYVQLPGGGSTAAMLRELPKF